MSTTTGSEAVRPLPNARLRGLRERIVGMLRDQLRCGATPKRLALSLSLGLLIGVMPLLWGASLICLGVSRLFRLNLVALQLANCLAYPLYLACYLPFIALGNALGARIGLVPASPQGWLETLLAGNALGLVVWLGLSLVLLYPLFLLLHGVILRARTAFLTKI